MKHVLFITGRYLPNMSPNGICIDNIIRKLPKNEYKITCICYNDYETIQDEKVRIIRVSRGILKSILYKNERKTSIIAKIICRIVRTLESVIDIPFLFTWPWNDPIYTEKVYRISEKVYTEQPFDYVVAVHMPISSLIVANKLKKRHPNIMYIPYFLDSLSGGRPISLFSEEWNREKKLKWEERLLPNADKIVLMEASREHHKHYSKDKPYYNKFIYLDIPLLSDNTREISKNPFPNGDTINVTFSGAALQPMRNISFFIRLAEEIHKNDNRIVFNIIGQCNCIEEFNDEIIHYYEPMPHAQLLPYLEHSDVLLNFGVRVPSAISGKIFEYMTFLKPIISTYSIPNEACIPYLKRYPLSLLLKETEEDITRTARVVVGFIYESIGKHVEMNEIKKAFINNMPETFIKEVFEKDDIQ